MEWEDGGNRSLQIAEGPCSVAFDWGNEGSLRVEASNGAGHIEDGHMEGAPAQEHSPQVQPCSLASCWLFSIVTVVHFISIGFEMTRPLLQSPLESFRGPAAYVRRLLGVLRKRMHTC